MTTRLGSVQDYGQRERWPEDAVYIGMPGNAARAFGISNEDAGPFGKPWECLRDPRGWEPAYREYLNNRLRSDEDFLLEVFGLQGKLLLCWCTAKARKSGQPVKCHGQTLIRAIEWLVTTVKETTL